MSFSSSPLLNDHLLLLLHPQRRANGVPDPRIGVAEVESEDDRGDGRFVEVDGRVRGVLLILVGRRRRSVASRNESSSFGGIFDVVIASVENRRVGGGRRARSSSLLLSRILRGEVGDRGGVGLVLSEGLRGGDGKEKRTRSESATLARLKSSTNELNNEGRRKVSGRGRKREMRALGRATLKDLKRLSRRGKGGGRIQGQESRLCFIPREVDTLVPMIVLDLLTPPSTSPDPS